MGTTFDALVRRYSVRTDTSSASLDEKRTRPSETCSRKSKSRTDAEKYSPSLLRSLHRPPSWNLTASRVTSSRHSSGSGSSGSGLRSAARSALFAVYPSLSFSLEMLMDSNPGLSRGAVFLSSAFRKSLSCASFRDASGRLNLLCHLSRAACPELTCVCLGCGPRPFSRE